jgi:hypothetical protein
MTTDQLPATDRVGADSYVERHILRILGLASTVLIATATLTYHALEDWSLVDSFYFSVVAISTVGFGDLTPSSDGSKLFTVLYLAMGIAVVTSFVNARLKSHARDISQRLADSDSPRSDVHRSG